MQTEVIYLVKNSGIFMQGIIKKPPGCPKQQNQSTIQSSIVSKKVEAGLALDTKIPEFGANWQPGSNLSGYCYNYRGTRAAICRLRI